MLMEMEELVSPSNLGLEIEGEDGDEDVDENVDHVLYNNNELINSIVVVKQNHTASPPKPTIIRELEKIPTTHPLTLSIPSTPTQNHPIGLLVDGDPSLV